VASVALNRLKPGERGKIVKVTGHGPTRRRITEMGVTAGTMVQVVRIAPLGDPIDVKVRGYHLSLRREEAAGITVDPA